MRAPARSPAPPGRRRSSPPGSSATTGSPTRSWPRPSAPWSLARRPALYDAERARGTEHNAALRKLANRLVGILHGCLKTRTLYDEATAWPHREKTPQSDIAA